MSKSKPIRRIGLILLIIFLMPALFFSAYEIASLNQDEETINEIYEKQLEAILFSANQYADDVLTGWIAKVELDFDQPTADSLIQVNKLLEFNPAILSILRYDTATKELSQQHRIGEKEKELEKELRSYLNTNDSTLTQLIKYQKSGFQKIQPISLFWMDLVALLFHPGNAAEDQVIYAIVIDPELFIAEVMGPRLQYIAQDKFALSAQHKEDQFPLYSTYDSANNLAIDQILTKDLWLLPNYELGISTRGISLKTIIQERTRNDLLLIIALDVFLIIGVILTFRNVRKEVQLAQNKSDFISSVSHELRTPLALISMFAETLEMGRMKSEQKRKEYYGIIHKEAQRLTGIVNNILSFSQLDAGKKELDLKSVDLTSICEDVINNYEFHLEQEGFTITKTLSQNIKILADADAISEIIINLIDNAIKYSEKTKKLKVEVKKLGNQAALTVQDYGVGISKSDQKYIFEKFFRSSTGDLAKKQGTGLGLALVKQIVDAHKATIELKSELDKGSTFIIKFPITSDQHV